jgi:cytoskeletal protein CcmA (bactofilin family)
MVKAKLFVAALVGTVASLFLFAGVVNAAGFNSGDQVSVPAGETVDGSFYAAGEDITIAGTVDGDVVCAGQNVTVSGVVNGDVICAAQTIRVAGEVKGDLRLAAQTATLESKIGQNATVFAQTLYTHENNRIGGDLGGGVQNADLAGRVGRDITIAAQSFKLSGAVGRDVDATSQNVTLEQSASIGRHLAYQSDREASIATGAQVAGEMTRSPFPVDDKKADAAKVYSIGAGIAWYMFFASLVVGLAVILLFPRVVHDVSSLVLKQPIRVALTGLALSFLAPVLVIAILVTLVGMPLAFFLGVVWLVIVLASGPLFAYFVGRMLLRKYATQPVLTMLVGVIAVFALYMIPVINVLTMLASLVIGTGILIVYLAKHYKKPVYSVKA